MNYTIRLDIRTENVNKWCKLFNILKIPSHKPAADEGPGEYFNSGQVLFRVVEKVAEENGPCCGRGGSSPDFNLEVAGADLDLMIGEVQEIGLEILQYGYDPEKEHSFARIEGPDGVPIMLSAD